MKNPFAALVAWLVSFFRSGKAEEAFNAAVALVPKALPIVKQVAVLTPNRTDDEIVAAFEQYALPGAEEYLSVPREKRGVVLLQLASEILAAEVPGTPTRIINTAVQLAYTGMASK